MHVLSVLHIVLSFTRKKMTKNTSQKFPSLTSKTLTSVSMKMMKSKVMMTMMVRERRKELLLKLIRYKQYLL